ncbi:NAD(P)-dependent alcohol dehydrogenase [Micromonospora sp. WMMA1363]|uniref:NAD(P)-dependent alcohol dehydrogenase n=1 Tax=Micromonospora sp. WMMA1363 TaxID=3053985 RepID=UPI00259D1E89|nr:NAD(P)-dependent alcohol dehydrogenase [Micromonospora sp. WMMA1363]MDM4718793.1 NAD(P)-dependent alcohol dehydrogenase [Micromonospora sp. WMMA1363]
MEGIRFYTYGPPEVLTFQDLGMPTVGADDVLIRVRAASVNPADWHLMRGTPYLVRLRGGLSRPKANELGLDLAGRVEAVGRNVTTLRVGDEVFGCRNLERAGTFAEYVTMPHDAGVLLKPVGLTFEQAASVPVAALTAYQALRHHGRLRPGQQVLVNGAAGGVGTFAVQIAKALGAEVTGVCSTRNAELVRSIGADHVIDYTKEDFTRGGRRHDIILDNVGNHPLSACLRALTPRGTIVPIGGTGGHVVGPLGRMLHALALSLFVRQRLVPFLARPTKDDLEAVRDLLESGKVTPVIDRTYPLNELPAAIRHLEAGHARGKIVITV